MLVVRKETMTAKNELRKKLQDKLSHELKMQKNKSVQDILHERERAMVAKQRKRTAVSTGFINTTSVSGHELKDIVDSKRGGSTSRIKRLKEWYQRQKLREGKNPAGNKNKAPVVKSSVLTEVSASFLSKAASEEMSQAVTNTTFARQVRDDFRQKLLEAAEAGHTQTRLAREVQPVYTKAMRATFTEKLPPYGTSMIMMREASYTVSLFFMISHFENLFFDWYPKPGKYLPATQMLRERMWGVPDKGDSEMLSPSDRSSRTSNSSSASDDPSASTTATTSPSTATFLNLKEELQTGLRGGSGDLQVALGTSPAAQDAATVWPTAVRGPLGGFGSVGQIPAGRWETTSSSPGSPSDTSTPPVSSTPAGVSSSSSSSSQGTSTSSQDHPATSSQDHPATSSQASADQTSGRYDGILDVGRGNPALSSTSNPEVVDKRNDDEDTPPLLQRRASSLRERSLKLIYEVEAVNLNTLDLSTAEYWTLVRYNLKKEAFVILSSSAIFTTLSTGPMVIASQQQAYSTPFWETARKIWRYEGFRGFFKGIVPRWITLTGSIFVVSNVINLCEEQDEGQHGLG
ncbi:unnamed protein product [Amoebophrya sp. A25]|nr:unnamed protein product [Amoebophrya sp. A25]|eukprot:GSA25T00010146001.1